MASLHRRERVCAVDEEDEEEETDRNSHKKENAASVVRATILSPPRARNGNEMERARQNSKILQNNQCKTACKDHRLVKSATMNTSVFAVVMEPKPGS